MANAYSSKSEPKKAGWGPKSGPFKSKASMPPPVPTGKAKVKKPPPKPVKPPPPPPLPGEIAATGNEAGYLDCALAGEEGIYDQSRALVATDERDAMRACIKKHWPNFRRSELRKQFEGPFKPFKVVLGHAKAHVHNVLTFCDLMATMNADVDPPTEDV